MAFDRDDVRRIAALARLDLTDAELDAFAAQLGDVLDHVAQLEDGTEAGDEIPDELRAMRTDVAMHDPLQQPPGEFAPAWADGFFSVPLLPAFDGSAGPDRRED